MSRDRATVMRVAYAGGGFHGFARQKGGLRTVQGELERVLSELYGVDVETRGASRTDAGVHARGQVVAFTTPAVEGPPADRLMLALRGRLPADLEVTSTWELSQDPERPLHPRHPNLGKHYCYRVRCARVHDPLTASFEWTLHGELDLPAMRAAAAHYVGEHDYASFRAAGCQAHTTVRRIHEVTIEDAGQGAGTPNDPGAEHRGTGQRIHVHVHGEAFLMHMVRIMVGTLIEVGQGRQSPDWIPTLFETPDRQRAGRTAPAQGLCLEEVKWPKELLGS